MFGHLKAEDFTNVIENAALPVKRRTHLESCPRCMATLEAVRAVQAQMESDSMDGLPEPDWAEFRSGVRDGMLSRSIQRNAAVRRWTGWPVRPVMAWALSAVFVVGLTTGMWVWNKNAPETPSVPVVDGGRVIDIQPEEYEVSAWSQGDVFDQLAQLKEDELENLRVLLEAESEKASPR